MLMTEPIPMYMRPKKKTGISSTALLMSWYVPRSRPMVSLMPMLAAV